jgi:hypothetical protein
MHVYCSKDLSFATFIYRYAPEPCKTASKACRLQQVNYIAGAQLLVIMDSKLSLIME